MAVIQGDIDLKWFELGGILSFLGYPTTDVRQTRDKVGLYNHFQGGSIYWSPDTGAHEVHGLIRDKWADLGWERSFLGYPITDETVTPDGIGRYNHFQGGSIYWTPDTCDKKYMV
ncbi:LGFP repeat-containing protein [Moorena producens]|uniref:LGFP repeat-containing protein n=1 Tax=Moorena producens TaxID=1155739 RepID=UPI003C74DFAB